jgi:predicted nucleic acid-binding protein
MNIIADTNIFLAVALDEPEKNRIVGLTLGSNIIAPSILPYEIGNALTAMLKRRQLSPEEAALAFERTQLVPVKLLHSDIKKSLEIAIAHNIYAYDAYFLQLALFHSCPLITLDKKMQVVARQLNIQILE